MPSTITLQNTIDWALPFTRYQPLTIGTANEPSITNANILKQTILGPPFSWRWNRATNATTSTVAGTQDYAITISDFGCFEKATIQDPTGIVTELEAKLVLGQDNATAGTQARPNYIATQLDNDTGSITFRLMPVPDDVYLITIIYQKAATLFTSLSGTWTPIPDWMQYVYSRGFLAMSFSAIDEPRFQFESTRFVASLLAVSEGLTEIEKNIFLGNFLSTSAQTLNAQSKAQQATQARGT